MPKPPVFPATYEGALQLKMSTLLRGKYLQYEACAGTYRWSIRGEETARIGFETYRPGLGDRATLTLQYSVSGEQQRYTVRLVSVPSNLGKGLVWYFVCPATYKRCRILYLVGGSSMFLHREAYSGVYYESQLRSKYYRYMDATLGAYFRAEQIGEEQYKPGFRPYYRGRPTRKYRRILRAERQARGVNVKELEEMFTKPTRKR